ncbi:DNA-processing protein DprA [Rheinheimera riviphila]|uniref:DNA-processing protein DprA n=1 Tax=Rheinheimera riviphila TaxID=1834037 RepID=A0A437QZK2_9GAMM|nr:DNA-processing protein DprA [Rheinheimera riviphila]RVU39955.1 DNA-processing protein DprA [Rheinheimera riviphila]
MNLSPMAQATVLLTCYFSAASAAIINSSDNVKPLSTAEWGRFALWLNQQGATPADLLRADVSVLLQGCQIAQLEASRILQLLKRGHSLALALEKWQRAGLWLVTRSDAEYPTRLKQRLKNASPPVLFGCGNKALLNAGGLAVVGSRNAVTDDLLFTQQVGAKAAAAGVAIVSGGARGVDEAAMLGAMHSSGAVVGVLADSLLKAATSAKWRQGLMNGTTVLISSVYPEAAFSAAHAMARNRYIYCLADSALVIHSSTKGGTFNGASENLQQAWVPLWVKPTHDIQAANACFVAKGGRWAEADINNLNIAALMVSQPVPAMVVGEPAVAGYNTASQLQADLFDTSHLNSELS